MKNLLNLKGAQLLSKKEQQSINGGGSICVDKCQDIQILGARCAMPDCTPGNCAQVVGQQIFVCVNL